MFFKKGEHLLESTAKWPGHIDDEKGIWHLTNQGEISWAELALRTAAHYKLNKSGIKHLHNTHMNFIAPRPLYSVLTSEKALLLPTLENAFKRYFQQSNLKVNLLATA